MGFMPMPASMLAGMATAVPKPAMPSRKPPKHQPMSRISTRWSLETLVSRRLMTSMAPVRRERLYVKIAAIMTRMIGQSAAANPSRADVTQSTTGMCQSVRARAAAMTRATRQALWPGILSTASATISHKMGSRVRTDCKIDIERNLLLFSGQSESIFHVFPTQPVLPIK